MIPAPYKWLLREEGPKILREALKLYGIKETPGVENNATIIEWAKEIGGPLAAWYKADTEAWCALFLAVCAKRAGYAPPLGFNALRALEWAEWGVEAAEARLGDVLVFTRPRGGHVALYVGEDREAFHVLGGNQSDEVCITRIGRNRLYAVRRCPFRTAPANIRKVTLKPSGLITRSEA